MRYLAGPWALGLLLTCLYVPEFMNRATSARWMAAGVIIPSMLLALRRRADPDFGAAVTGLAFVALACASTLWAVSMPDALRRSWELALGVGTFMWAASSSRGDMVALVVAAGIGMAVNSILAVIQDVGIETPLAYVTHTPAGTFLNGNYMAEGAAAVLFLILAAPLPPLPRGLLAIGCLPALFLGGSRGALVAVFLVAAAWVAQKGRWRILGLLCASAGLAAGWYVWSRWGDPYALVTRWPMWLNTLAAWDWFGRGAGSYLTGYAMIHDVAIQTPPSVFGFLIRPQSAHNDMLTILFEHGAAGVALFAAFSGRCLWLARRSPILLTLVGILALGLTNFPLYNPLPFVLFCAACGWASSERHFSR